MAYFFNADRNKSSRESDNTQYLRTRAAGTGEAAGAGE